MIIHSDNDERTKMEPKYPNITVNLIGRDGNAFGIIGSVNAALRKGGVEKTERDAFAKEAMSGDYDNLLVTVMSWVDIY